MLDAIRGIYGPLLGLVLYGLIGVPCSYVAKAFLTIGLALNRAAEWVKECADRMMVRY